MTLPLHPSEPGWYEKEPGDERYWNGRGWGPARNNELDEDDVLDNDDDDDDLDQVPDLSDPKIKTLGWVAFVGLLIGVGFVFVALQNPLYWYHCGAFLGFALSTWVLWLAAGAIVDAINDPRN